MIITLNPKDKLVVRFAGTDGEFEIHFDSSELPQQLVVRETAGLNGNRAGVANSTLYHDDWTMTNQGWRNKPLTKPLTQAESKFEPFGDVVKPTLAQDARKPYDQYLVAVLNASYADNPEERDVNKDLGVRHIDDKLNVGIARARKAWEVLTDVQVRTLLMAYLSAGSEQEGQEYKGAVVRHLLLNWGHAKTTAPHAFEDLIWALGNPEPSEDDTPDDAGVADDDSSDVQ